MKKIYLFIVMSFALLVSSCEDYYDTKNDPVIYGETYFNADLSIDKACYKPGDKVQFTLKEIPSGECENPLFISGTNSFGGKPVFNLMELGCTCRRL